MARIFNNYWADYFWSYWGRLQRFDRTSNYGNQTIDVRCAFEPWSIPEPFRAFPKPISAMVFDSRHRRWNDMCHARIWSDRVPQRGLVQIADEAFVVSPEFLFLEFARRFDLPQTIALGYELCGTYSINPLTGRALFNLPPITTAAKLKRFVMDAGSVHGAKRARTASCYVCNNSASPMETSLHMHYQLPRRLHGFALSGSTMNKSVPLNERAQLLYPHQTCRCDILYPKTHRAIEYYGRFHCYQMEGDFGRVAALKVMRYDTTVLTYDEYNNLWALGEIANTIAREQGIYMKRGNIEPTEGRQRLHESLRLYCEGYGRKPEGLDEESLELAIEYMRQEGVFLKELPWSRQIEIGAF